MISTTTVMKQIWDAEGILVKFKEDDMVPAYDFEKRFPNKRSVQDFIKIRLRRYCDFELTVMKSWNKAASDKTTVDSLRQGYSSATLELVEKQFENLALRSTLIKTKINHVKKMKSAHENLESAKIAVISAKKAAETSKNTVTQISKESAATAAKLEITEKILNNTEYICNSMEKVIKQLCQSDASLAGQSDKITRFLKEKLLIKETADRLQQIRLNMPE